MSHVRMCDQCGEIFSEREDNWSTYQGAQNVRDPITKVFNVITVALDRCPACTTPIDEVPLPKMRLGGYDQAQIEQAKSDAESKDTSSN